MNTQDFNYTLQPQADGIILLELFTVGADGSATQTAIVKIQPEQVLPFIAGLVAVS